MVEVPEHLLKRSAERRAQLSGTSGEAAPDQAAEETTPETTAVDAPAEAAAPAPAAVAGDDSQEITEDRDGVPAHLLERARKRRVAAAGGAAGAVVPAAAAASTTVKTAAPNAPSGTGPDGHTQRLLTVVKSGSIQQTRAEAVDKVHTWPHLLVIELAASLAVLAMMLIFSTLVRAPLLGLADVNQTPNPSKAPWYFLGLQEMLTMFHPMVAGVTIPGMGIFLLIISPYVDKNSSNKPDDRKWAISMFTLFLVFWTILVIIGSFFRGAGFNFVFPWKDGVFFEL
ncbi:MAG: menaquinol-cytochrome c reductase cytochrome b subunit [Acidimicrobiia bacterium]|jgi:menaquinol-cytochrome c reductase cytochrome b/c subunit|nr:menaquinol-cytochrome c reductase cytochrome b subunit [Acidimicrobiia bacterium]MBJ7512765.1 menaquinol-cytochrome c reductase cytochrome b subunit [Acidimicrobiia bacterium]